MTLLRLTPAPPLPPSFTAPAFIDPALDEQDRRALEQAMHGLSAVQRHNLLLLQDGRLLANRPELLAAFTLTELRAHPVTGRLQASGEGGLGELLGGVARLFNPPAAPHPSQPKPRGVQVECKPEQSGPYRRVYSHPGYSFQASRVYLPSDSSSGSIGGGNAEMKEEKAAGKGDTAFIYMGGWGGRGGAVDAGFQHGHAGGGPQDDWAPFFLVQQPQGASAVTVSDEQQAGGGPWRILAGSQAELRFWVSQDADLTYLNLYVAGTTSVDRTDGTLTLRAAVDASFGWSAAGGDNILKRMTTIGQKFGQEDLSTGSYLRGVRWADSRIGQDEASAHTWTPDDTAGYCSYPDPKSPEGQRQDGQGPKWQVAYLDAANETDSIVLK